MLDNSNSSDCLRSCRSYSTVTHCQRNANYACHGMNDHFPPDEGNKNIFSISDTLTSCKVHIVSRKCLRLQIPMSFGQAGVPGYAATGILLVTRRKRFRCTLAASLSHVPTRRHVPLALVPSLSRGRLVQVACNYGSHDTIL